VNQEVFGARFDKNVLKEVVFMVFMQPVKLRLFQRVVWVDGKTAFWVEISQRFVVESSRHI